MINLTNALSIINKNYYRTKKPEYKEKTLKNIDLCQAE